MKKLNTTKMLLAVIAALSLSAPLNAQQMSSSGGGGFTLGYGYMDVSKLHSFVPSGVAPFKNNHFLIGGTGHALIGKLVIGGSGFGIIGEEIRSDSFNYSIGGGLGTFDIGYLVLDKEKAKIYPMLGIGGGGFGIQISKNKNVSASEIRNNSAQEVNISMGSPLLDISFNIDLLPAPAYNEKDNSYGGIMTGIKIGYIYSLPSSVWNFSGGDITGGPSFGMNMLYARLVIGGFGSKR